MYTYIECEKFSAPPIISGDTGRFQIYIEIIHTNMHSLYKELRNQYTSLNITEFANNPRHPI